MGKVKAKAVVAKAASATAQLVKRHTPLKFFRETAPYGYFSNFWKHPRPLVYKGEKYPTAEHLYQARKFIFEDAPAENAELVKQVRIQPTPAKAMFLARGRSNARWPWQMALSVVYNDALKKGAVPDPKWDERRVDVMREVVALKAEQDEDFAGKLKATGDQVIEEASPYDDFWGTGKNGMGKNWLGKILMEVRGKL